MKSMQNLLFATAMTATLAEAALTDCSEKYCRSSNGAGGFDCWAGHGEPFACSGGRQMKLDGRTLSPWGSFKTYKGYTCCKVPPGYVPPVNLPKDCRFTKERKVPQICQDGQGRGKLIDLPASKGKSWTLRQCAAQARAKLADYFVYSIGNINCAIYEDQATADQCQKWYEPNNFVMVKKDRHCLNWVDFHGGSPDYVLGQAANVAECAALSKGRNPWFTYGGNGTSCVAEPMKNDDCGYGWSGITKWNVYKLAPVNSYELYCDSDHKRIIKEITMGWRIKQSGPVKRDYTVTVSFEKTTTDVTTARQDILSSISDKTTVKVSNTVSIGMSLSAGGFGATADNKTVNDKTTEKTKFRETKIANESKHSVATALKQTTTTKTTFDCPDHPTKYKSIYQWVTQIEGIATVESANFACIYGGLEPRCIPKYCVDRQCQTCRTDDAASALKDEGEIQALKKKKHEDDGKIRALEKKMHEADGKNQALEKKVAEHEKTVAELSTEVRMFTKGGDKQMCPVIKNLATKFC